MAKQRRVNQRWKPEERPVIGSFLRHYHATLCDTIERLRPFERSDESGSISAQLRYYRNARSYVEFMGWQVGVRLKEVAECQAGLPDSSG